MIQDSHVSPLAVQVAAHLEDARARTLLLIAPLSEAELRAQHDPLMGPILWDLGHIAHFEELWLLRNLQGPVEFGEMPGMFNPFENPRAVRGALDMPTLPQTLSVMAETRARVLERIPSLDLAGGDPLLRDGYVFRMVAQHEYQHGETILQALQLKEEGFYRAPRGWDVPEPRWTAEAEMVRFPGGRVEIGTADRTAAYDNERPPHAVELRPFLIDATPVTNGAYLEFMEAGGYDERRFWSGAGWAWREESGARSYVSACASRKRSKSSPSFMRGPQYASADAFSSRVIPNACTIGAAPFIDVHGRSSPLAHRRVYH
jgi:iron(II)-dependent oxidoreductase